MLRIRLWEQLQKSWSLLTNLVYLFIKFVTILVNHFILVYSIAHHRIVLSNFLRAYRKILARLILYSFTALSTSCFFAEDILEVVGQGQTWRRRTEKVYRKRLCLLICQSNHGSSNVQELQIGQRIPIDTHIKGILPTMDKSIGLYLLRPAGAFNSLVCVLPNTA